MRRSALLLTPLSLVLACRAVPPPEVADAGLDSGDTGEDTALRETAGRDCEDAEADTGGFIVFSGGGTDADGDGSIAGIDCDDADATAYPGATEADDGADDDCDGWVDEDFVAVGDVVVTEINRQSRFGTGVVNNNGSWVEVHNTSDRTIDLANWVLSRGASAPFNSVTIDPASAPVLAPGDYAVFCDTDDYVGSAAAYPLTCDYVWGDETQPASYVGTYRDNTFYLRRDADAVGLYIGGSRTTGTRIDQVRWYYDATNGYWPRNAQTSMSLDPAYRDEALNDSVSAWCSTTQNSGGTPTYSSTWRWYDVTTASRDEYGTPGAANYDCPVDPDLDGDGVTGATDCDEGDSSIYPGATEACDGVDQDCDGTIDEGTPGGPWYTDADGDGYGDPATSVSGCIQPPGTVADGSDCDDTDAAVSPAGSETCNGADDDCDGSVDEGGIAGSTVFFADADGDGFGDTDSFTTSCLAPSGYVGDDGDCDDADATAYPDAAEQDDLVDDDCDEYVDEDFVQAGDLVVSEINRQARFGGVSIVNDGSWVEIHNASARTVDLSNWTFVRGITSFNSITLDPAEAPLLAPGDYAVFCDTATYEGSAAAWPLGCDYVWGDPTRAASYVGTYHDNTFYLRRDADRVALYVEGSRTTGRLVDSVQWSFDATSGYWPRDARFSMSLDPRNLDATENDDRTNWCSTASNVAGTPSNNTSWRWYDVSGTSNDEHGTPGAANYDCLDDNDLDGDGADYTVDCDDGDATRKPGATELCDGIDQDCDGTVDDGASGTTAYYADLDGDGYGAGSATLSCLAPADHVTVAGDCDDDEATTNPGAAEVCDDHADNDCDPDPTVCEWSGSQTVKLEYDLRAYGTAASWSVGHSVANGGDFDGDGYDDAVVGAAYYDAGGVTDNGRLHLWYGPVDTSDSISSADLLIDGSTALNADNFGWSARFAGDVDGDGIDDLIAGAWRADSTDAGRAYLFRGGTAPDSVDDAWATFSTTSGSNYAGHVVDGGDVDGDGRGDVLVTAYGRATLAGAVGVWRATDIGGGAEDLSTNASIFITHATAGGNFGYAAELVEDLDGDGLDDLVVGAPATVSTTTPGAAYVFYGLDTLSGTVASTDADAILSGSTNGSRFGLAVAGLGDTDGDGNADLAITADKDDTSSTDAGALFLFTTAPTGAVTGASVATTVLTGEATLDYFGRTAAGVGDVNGDGFADLFVGATGYDADGLSGSGAVYLVYGPAPTGTHSISGYDLRLTGANTADAVGYAVAGGGDVNADGYADFMTSAPSWDGFGWLNSGGSWLYYGHGE